MKYFSDGSDSSLVDETLLWAPQVCVVQATPQTGFLANLNPEDSQMLDDISQEIRLFWSRLVAIPIKQKGATDAGKKLFQQQVLLDATEFPPGTMTVIEDARRVWPRLLQQMFNEHASVVDQLLPYMLQRQTDSRETSIVQFMGSVAMIGGKLIDATKATHFEVDTKEDFDMFINELEKGDKDVFSASFDASLLTPAEKLRLDKAKPRSERESARE